MFASILRKSTVKTRPSWATLPASIEVRGECRFWSGVLPQPLQLSGESPAPEPAPAIASATTNARTPPIQARRTQWASIKPEIVCPPGLFAKCGFT